MTRKSVEETPRHRLSDVEFDSPRGGRVTAYLVEPRRVSAGTVGVVFGHWGPGNRAEFLAEALLYARAGAVSILIDYPWTRPKPWRRKVLDASTTDQEDLDALAQAVVDLRRAADVLLQLGLVDPKRLTQVGHSYGAQFGAVLSAVDRRFATLILMAGTPSLSAIWLESQDPQYEDLRRNVGVEALKKSLAVTGALDGVRFVPCAAPAPLLFQFATRERAFSVESMKRYAAAARDPKTVRWYPTGHELNDPQAMVDRAVWLERHAGLRGAARVVTAR